MPQRLEPTRALVVVLQQEAVELSPFKDSRNRPIVASRVELALVVAAADVNREGHAGVTGDDRVVHLDACIDQGLRVAAALAVSLAQLGVEERRVLGSIDLNVSAPEPNQLIDLSPAQIDHV